MKNFIFAILAVLSFNQIAIAADSQSPYDKNPACLDRNVDSSKGDCVIQDDGSPRHKHPPRKATSSGSATSAPAGREAAPAAGRKGS